VRLALKTLAQGMQVNSIHHNASQRAKFCHSQDLPISRLANRMICHSHDLSISRLALPIKESKKPHSRTRFQEKIISSIIILLKRHRR